MTKCSMNGSSSVLSVSRVSTKLRNRLSLLSVSVMPVGLCAVLAKCLLKENCRLKMNYF